MNTLRIHKKLKVTVIRVAMVREKVLENENFPGQGKVRELRLQSGKFKKMKKSRGNVREFQNFPKKMLVKTGFWKF